LTTVSPSATTNVIISANTVANYTAQTVNLSFGTFSHSSDLSVAIASGGSSICSLPTQSSTCSIPVSITLTNTANAQTSYSIPAIGTRTSPTNPPEVQTGTISVNVTGPDCHTGCCGSSCGGGPTITSCTNSANGQSITQGTSVTLHVTVTDGSGSYTYSWTGTGDGLVGNDNPHTYQPPVGGPYIPQVKVIDSVSGQSVTSSSGTCGSVTVTGGTSGVTKPELWPGLSGDNTGKYSSYFLTSGPTSAPLTIHRYPGDSATVSYTYPNDGSLTNCTGLPINYVGSGSAPSPSGWTTLNTSGSGYINLPNLIQGIYTLQYYCTKTSDNLTRVLGNPVEIDVTPSTIREQ
jgi:hypothetical protein